MLCSRRFRTHECALFKHRMDKLNDNDRSAFMAANGLEFDFVDNEERNLLSEQLIGLCDVKNEGMLRTTNYYK
jgi:hypothetical protein